MKCSICKEECDCPYGHNALPVKKGRCCSICNDRCVIPARIRIAFAMMENPYAAEKKDSPKRKQRSKDDGAAQSGIRFLGSGPDSVFFIV